MGIFKDPKIASLFKLLSEPVRLAIMDMVCDRGEVCVNDMVKHIGVSQSNVSHHLTYMRLAGLLRVRRGGKSNLYSVSPDAVPLFQALATSLSVGIEKMPSK